MVVDVSSSTVTLDHLYAKKDILLEEDLFSSASDFLNTWTQVSWSNSTSSVRLSFHFQRINFSCCTYMQFVYESDVSQPIKDLISLQVRLVTPPNCTCWTTAENLLAQAYLSFTFEIRSYQPYVIMEFRKSRLQ
jgi:hypothetical protein